MIEGILKRAAHVVLSRYRLIACLFAFLTAVSIYTVYHMEIKTDLIDVLPRGNPAVAQFRDFVQKYNILESVTVVVSSRTKSVNEYADLIETLAVKLKQSPLVEQVDYTAFGQKNEFFLRNFPLFLDNIGLKQLAERLSTKGIERQIRLNYQKLVSPVASPADSELIERDPLNLHEIVAARMRRSASDNPFDLSFGYYMTKDHSTALIFVKPSGRSKDMAFVKKLRPELDRIVRATLAEGRNPQGVTIQLTGGHIFSDDMRRVIRHDIISSTLLSVVLIALIIWLAYKVRLVVLLIVACTTLTSLSMTLAVAYLIFGSLNIVTSIVCGLLIGMYVDYCILVLKRYGDELLLRKDRLAALELTMTKAGAAMVVSAVTTAISFFSIIFTKFDGLYELGIVSGIGVLICFFVTFFLMTALLVWASADGPDSILSVKEPVSGVGRLSALIEKYPRRIACVSILLVIVLAFGMIRLRFDNDPEHIGIKNNPAVIAMKSLNQKLRHSGEPLQVMIKAKNMEELSSSFDKLEQRIARWKTSGLISGADSLSSFLPPPQEQRHSIETMRQLFKSHPISISAIAPVLKRELERFGIAYEGRQLETYISTIAAAVNRSDIIGLNEINDIADSRIDRFYNRHDISLVAYLYSGAGVWDKGVVESMRKEIEEEGHDWVLLGSPILYGEIRTSIFWGSSFAAITTLVLNVLFVFLFLGDDRRYIGLAMLPVCLGFLMTPAIMGWLGAPFNFINIGTMALIFGFGVDYGVYVMQAYLREETRDINNALRLSGKNVMMCAATTIAGCGSLMTAEFAGIASIGLVLTIGSVCCSATTLILLPSLLWLKKRKDAPSFENL
ncbi:MAG: efflux RND transporter permease subunit [Dissulfurispiraceae bacterium]